ncbi:MAG: hypothetical protein R3C05_01660 [Pirellulaceae bacterium]
MIRCGLLILMLAVVGSVVADDDLRVLTEERLGVPPTKQLEQYLKQLFYRYSDERLDAFASLKSQADCKEWQQQRRRFFIDQLGGLPQRTPLNPRMVGKLEGEGYRVENLLFESRPGHHVTANLYLPESEGPHPAVIVPCGHSHNGKAAGGYQRICILLARHGMAALCYDPIGQGNGTKCSTSITSTRISRRHRIWKCLIPGFGICVRSSIPRWDWAASCWGRTSLNIVFGTACVRSIIWKHATISTGHESAAPEIPEVEH